MLRQRLFLCSVPEAHCPILPACRAAPRTGPSRGHSTAPSHEGGWGWGAPWGWGPGEQTPHAGTHPGPVGPRRGPGSPPERGAARLCRPRGQGGRRAQAAPTEVLKLQTHPRDLCSERQGLHRVVTSTRLRTPRARLPGQMQIT